MEPSDLMIEELPGLQNQANFKPFAHPYFVEMRNFLSPRTANYSPHAFPATTFGPGKVPKAYKFPSNVGAPKLNTKYGIGSLGGNIPKSDVTKFCQENGYPTPNMKLLAIPGANTVTDPGGANVENNLDWQMVMQAWHEAFPTVPCDITIVFGPNTDNGIADVTTALRKAGCNVISWSWGAAKSQWSASAISYTETEFATCISVGIVVDAASGDNSMNDSTSNKVLDYPAASVHVWNVGGTALTINASGQYVSEKAWGDGLPGDPGGGGGVDPTTPMPDYQKGIAPGQFRCGPDWSANADPQTGYHVWSDGKVVVIGGTSASAPLSGGLFGVVLAMGGSLKNFQSLIYTNRKTCCTDIILGSNGSSAVAGYDTATGIGSPIGTAVASVLSAGTPPIPPLPPPDQQPSFTLTQTLPPGTYKRVA